MSLTGAEYIHSPVKRNLDLTIVGGFAVGGAIASPLLLSLGIAAGIELRANPVFVQERLGKDGSEFDMYKFRSLHERRDREVHSGGADHPHASRIGRLLRATSIDELPQFISVLRGDISVVGIRPIATDLVDVHREMVDDEALFAEWQGCYDQNPGLTGEGQLYSKDFSKHDAEVIRRRMEIDIEAFHDASLSRDIQVIARTPLKLLQVAFGERHVDPVY